MGAVGDLINASRRRILSGGGRRALALLAVLALAGCSARADADTRPDHREGAPSTAGSAAGEQPPDAGPVRVPEPQAGLTTLAQSAPASGSRRVGAVSADAKAMWVTVLCRGGGIMKVNLEPFGAFTLNCPVGSTLPSANQIVFKQTHELNVKVEAPAAVTWAMRIEQ
jgi:hypothetical protein